MAISGFASHHQARAGFAIPASFVPPELFPDLPTEQSPKALLDMKPPCGVGQTAPHDFAPRVTGDLAKPSRRVARLLGGSLFMSRAETASRRTHQYTINLNGGIHATDGCWFERPGGGIALHRADLADSNPERVCRRDTRVTSAIVTLTGLLRTSKFRVFCSEMRKAACLRPLDPARILATTAGFTAK